MRRRRSLRRRGWRGWVSTLSLRSTITEEYLSTQGTLPSHYWPLQEAAGASSAIDLMGGPSSDVRGWGAVARVRYRRWSCLATPSATGIHFQDTGSQGIRATLATPLSPAFPNVVSIEYFVAGGTTGEQPRTEGPDPAPSALRPT